jgi:peptide/nickel transport system ATP-binding protein
MITEFREAIMDQLKVKAPKALLSVKDLHVWYELRRFGFGHAGYVKAVDGVSFDLEEGETVRADAASPV